MTWIDELKDKEWRLYSQHGEDGITLAILPHLLRTGVALEIGASNGDQNNTRVLRDLCEWKCYWYDGKWENESVRKLHVTRDNMKQVVGYEKIYNIQPFDVFSLDVDGVDWWLWKAFLETGARPGMCILEYNGAIREDVSVTVPYSDNFQWDGTDYHGASLLAFERLGAQFGYYPVYCESSGTNVWFLHESVLEAEHVLQPLYVWKRRHAEFGWRADLPWDLVWPDGTATPGRCMPKQEIGAFA